MEKQLIDSVNNIGKIAVGYVPGIYLVSIKSNNCDGIEPWMILLPKYDVWRCPVCKSIYVYEGDKESPIMIYRLET